MEGTRRPDPVTDSVTGSGLQVPSIGIYAVFQRLIASGLPASGLLAFNATRRWKTSRAGYHTLEDQTLEEQSLKVQTLEDQTLDDQTLRDPTPKGQHTLEEQALGELTDVGRPNAGRPPLDQGLPVSGPRSSSVWFSISVWSSGVGRVGLRQIFHTLEDLMLEGPTLE